MRELAEQTGMSISYISQIERGEIDPSLSSLRKIAAVFQMPLYMLLDDTELVGNLTIRKDQQLVSLSEDGKVKYRYLTPLPSVEYYPEALLVEFEIAPHAQDVTEAVQHNSEELTYVLEGQLTVQIGDVDIVVNEGDSTVVQKNLPHICKNTTDRPVRGIAVFSPPVWGRMDLKRNCSEP